MIGILIAIGLIWGLAAIFGAISIGLKRYWTKLKRVCTASASAVVIDIQEQIERTDGRISKLYYPILEYWIDGKQVINRSSVGSYPCKYEMGQEVNIQYNPNKVKEIIMKEDDGLRVIAKVFGIIASILGVVGVIVLVIAWMNMK